MQKLYCMAPSVSPLAERLLLLQQTSIPFMRSLSDQSPLLLLVHTVTFVAGVVSLVRSKFDPLEPPSVGFVAIGMVPPLVGFVAIGMGPPFVGFVAIFMEPPLAGFVATFIAPPSLKISVTKLILNMMGFQIAKRGINKRRANVWGELRKYMMLVSAIMYLETVGLMIDSWANLIYSCLF